MLSVLTLGAWAQTSPYTGVAVSDIVSGNDYYLYNVESGLWLQNNDRTTSDWHTRGQLGTRGIDLQLNADGAGYKINAKFGRSSINHENLYLDANDNDVWVFESVTVGNVSNAVTISCSGTVLGARNYVRTYKAKNLFTEEEITGCKDSTDYVLPVKPGDVLHIVERTSRGVLAKHNGVSGWYFGNLKEP